MDSFKFINKLNYTENNINSLIESLDLEKYIVILSVYDEASKYWDNFTASSKLGLKKRPSYRSSYLAVIDKKANFVYEDMDSKSIFYDYSIENLKIHITSSGFGMMPNKSDIIVNDVDYSYNLRGLNISIILRETGSVDGVYNCDFFADKELRLDTPYRIFNERLSHLMHGMQIAEKYCLHSNSIFYMILNRHIGDAARVLKAVKGIKNYYGPEASRFHFGSDNLNSEEAKAKGIKKEFEKRKCIKKIVVVTNKSISGVARLYSKNIDDIIILSQLDLNDLELYAYSGVGMHENIMTDQFPGGKLLGRWNFDEGSWVRWLMFGVNDTMWNLCMPVRLKESECNMEVYSDTEIKVSKLLSNLKIDVDKLVILCPVAKSSSMLARTIWEKLTKKLKDIGYSLYTNIGPGEQPIVGTKALEVDIDEIVCLSNKGARVIGVQCGLMDILLWSHCSNFIVINPIVNSNDITYARDVGCISEVNKKPNNVTYLRIEHFEEDYVLKLLMDNFH